MKNRIMIIAVLGLFVLTLTNCSTIYQNARQNDLYDSSPYASVLDLVPKNISPNPAPVAENWNKLMQIGPGSDALVTLRDGTLRGGQIFKVTSDSLGLITAGHVVSIARSEIALVELKGSSGALAGGLIGFLVTGVGLTAILCQEGDCPGEAWLLGISLLGIPGGLVGALIGSQTGGDIQIVP
jgi:hypothetical protein